MQGYCRIVFGCIADGVIFMRRDQATGRAELADHRILLDETAAVFALFGQVELLDLDGTVADRFHAPHAAVIMDRRALLRPPGHGNNRITMLLAAVQQPTRIMIADRRLQFFRQAQAA